MNILQNRIDSFQNSTVKWPHGEKQFPKIETYAKAGLYFVKRPKAIDTVRCFLCDINLSHWKAGQSPMTRHAKESPDCPLTILNFPDLDIHKPATSKRASATALKNARSATFNRHTYWPPNKGTLDRKKYPSASKLADAGFYFSPTREQPARIKCFSCGAEVLGPADYEEHFASCSSRLAAPVRRSNRRRDTTESHDSFKTAPTELPSPEIINRKTPLRRTQKTATTAVNPPAKRKLFTPDIPREEDDRPTKRKITEDDSFWSIEKSFEPIVKKPQITFGTSSKQHRLGSSTNKVNIFSGIKSSAITPVKASLIEKIVPVRPMREKIRRASQQEINDTPMNVKKRALNAKSSASSTSSSSSNYNESLASKKKLDTLQVVVETASSQKSTTSSSSQPASSKPLSQTSSPIPPVVRPYKDKGKGRADEINLTPIKKPISLSKSKTKASMIERSPTPSASYLKEPDEEHAIIMLSTSASGYSTAPITPNINILANINTEARSPSPPPLMSRSPPRSAFANLMQSTPTTQLMSMDDMFGDLSPITRNNKYDPLLQDTPVITSRTRRVIGNIYQLEDPVTTRAVSPVRTVSPVRSPVRGSSPAPPTEETTLPSIQSHPPSGQLSPIRFNTLVDSPKRPSVPILDSPDIIHPTILISNEIKHKTTQAFLEDMISSSVNQVRQHGLEQIRQVQQVSDRLRQELIDSHK